MLKRLRIAALLYGLLIAGTVAVCANRPLAFLKSNSIVPDTIGALDQRPDTAKYLDVAPLIAAIPYAADGGSMDYSVQPEQRYRATIEQGGGNCSNLSHGLAYELNRLGIDYRIVHVIPRDGFMDGNGHTLVNVPMTYQGRRMVGVVEMLGGGLPFGEGGLVTVDDMRHGPIQDYSFVHLNQADRDVDRWYGDKLAGSVIGVVPSTEVRPYYDFIESIYVPLGNQKLEKRVYPLLGLMFAQYPRTYVAKYDSLFEGCTWRRDFFRLALWLFRSTMVVIPALILMESIACFRRRRAKSAISAHTSGSTQSTAVPHSA